MLINQHMHLCTNGQHWYVYMLENEFPQHFCQNFVALDLPNCSPPNFPAIWHYNAFRRACMYHVHALTYAHHTHVHHTHPPHTRTHANTHTHTHTHNTTHAQHTIVYTTHNNIHTCTHTYTCKHTHAQ